jgi:hypothetical protein
MVLCLSTPNRVLVCEFLRELVFTPGHSNILEDFLWPSLSCVEMVALTRVLTLFDSQPLRWLCGKGAELRDWSVYKAAGALDLVEQLLIKVAADGAALFDPELGPFGTIAAEQPLFKKWCDELSAETITAPNGKTQHQWFKLVLAEARTRA